MSETVPHRVLTVKAARAMLNDTRCLTARQIDEAETLIRKLLQRRPGRSPDGICAVVRCEYCGSTHWSLHTDNDDEVWCCDACHRAPATAEEGRVFRAAQRERNAKLAEEQAAIAAAAPSLREVLAAAETELANTQSEISKVEAAVVIARAKVEVAQVALNAAAEALSVARAANVKAQMESMLNPAGAAVKSRSTATETAAVAAAVAELEAATEVRRLLEDRLSDGRNSLHWAEYRRGNAAKAVLHDERR